MVAIFDFYIPGYFSPGLVSYISNYFVASFNFTLKTASFKHIGS